MRLGAFGTNRTVYNAKVSLFLRYSKGEDRWSVQKLRLLYIMKTWLSNKGSITPNAYCLISEQIILGQVRYSHFTQGCSRYLHSSWRYKKTDWNNTLKPQFFCDRSKYWSFLDRVTADTRSVHEGKEMHMQTCLTRVKNQLFFTYKSIVLHCWLKRLLFTGHYLSRKSRFY